MSYQCEIMSGNALSAQRIDLMNAQRIVEYGENNKDFKNNEQESTFFFIEQDTQVKAFGMLKPVTITLQDASYDILGIGNIIAIEKSAGYGKVLMTEIKAYLQQHDKTGLGFCWHTVRQFYRQCGYQVFDGLSDRFRYSFAARDGRKEKLEPGLGVIHYPVGDALMQHIAQTNELMYINVPFW